MEIENIQRLARIDDSLLENAVGEVINSGQDLYDTKCHVSPEQFNKIKKLAKKKNAKIINEYNALVKEDEWNDTCQHHEQRNKKIKLGVLLAVLVLIVAITFTLLCTIPTSYYIVLDADTVYYVEYGDALALDNVTGACTYVLGQDKQTELDSYEIIGFDSSQIGVQEVTIQSDKYGGTISVEVVKLQLSEVSFVTSSSSIVWSAVEYATSYVLTVNGEEIVLGAAVTSYDLSDYSDSSTLTITLKATGDSDITVDSVATSGTLQFNQVVERLKLENGIVSFVNNNESQVVIIDIDGTSIEFTGTSYDLNNLLPGSYDISIYVKETEQTLASSAVQIEVTKLETPTITVTNNIVSLTSVSGATGYLFTVNGVAIDAMSYDLSAVDSGEHVFSAVVSGGDNIISSDTATISCIVDPSIGTTVFAVDRGVLCISVYNAYIGATYQVDLTTSLSGEVDTTTYSQLADSNYINISLINYNISYESISAVITIIDIQDKELYSNSSSKLTYAQKSEVASISVSNNILNITCQSSDDTVVLILNNQEIQLDEFSYGLSELSVGVHEIAVYVAGDDSALNSQLTTIQVEKLTSPVITVTDGIAYLDTVNGATSYYFAVNNSFIDATSIDLSEYTAGEYTLTATAYGGDNIIASDTTTAVVVVAPSLGTATLSSADNTLYINMQGAYVGATYTFEVTTTTNGKASTETVTYLATASTETIKLSSYSNSSDSISVTYTITAITDKTLLSTTSATVTFAQNIALSNVSVTDGVLTFSNNNTDKNVAVEVSGNTTYITTTSYDFSNLDVGTYVVTLYVVGSDSFLVSEITTVTINKLAAPTITFIDDVAYMGTVASATSYVFAINGVAIEGTSIDLSQYASGEHTLTATAYGGDNIITSNTTTKTVTVSPSVGSIYMFVQSGALYVNIVDAYVGATYTVSISKVYNGETAVETVTVTASSSSISITEIKYISAYDSITVEVTDIDLAGVAVCYSSMVAIYGD